MFTSYNQSAHTPDAFKTQLNELYLAAPDALLVGSLGRSAIYNYHGAESSLEFTMRRETPLGSSTRARDIDVIGAALPATTGPFPVDVEAFSSPDCSLLQDEDGTWILVSERRDFCEPLDGRVMRGIASATVVGAPCLTVPLQTHKALHGLNGPLRRKDVKALKALESIEQLADSELLPEELYDPFKRLASIKRPGITPKVLATYRRYVPTAIDQRIAPKTHFIGEGLRLLDRIIAANTL
jgi:hypothetical protein